MSAPILAVRDLAVDVIRPQGRLRLVDGVSFEVRRNEVFGIVGESGSGKSIAMLAIMGLLVAGQVEIAQGEVLLNGTDLRALSAEGRRVRRGRELAMIFQDPMTSLNPVLTIGSQIAEMIRIHHPARSRAAIRDRVIELLALVGVPDPARRYRQYPHEFSGGMRQRAMIAMAVANEPALLIADEPTTALDVTIQAQVMEVLAEVRARTGASMILITHDLGLVAEHADRVAVMYGGRLVETADVADLFEDLRHPYTAGLLASRPGRARPGADLISIPGQPPAPASRPRACVFQPRCGLHRGRPICGQTQPPLAPAAPGHAVACHFQDETRSWIRDLSGAPIGSAS